MKEITSYICPYCHQKQDIALSWQTAKVSYYYHLKLKTWEQKEIVGGDLESWACPNCGKDLPYSITKRFPI